MEALEEQDFVLFRVVSLVPRTIPGAQYLLMKTCQMHACLPGTVLGPAFALCH